LSAGLWRCLGESLPFLQPLAERTAPRLAESGGLEKNWQHFGFSVEKFGVWLFSNI
jgi:hypothetical protein